MTTTNAFIFSWHIHGIESIVPITQYEHWDKDNLIKILKEQKTTPNPLNKIIRSILLRARINNQRHYEVYAIDCDETMDENYWLEQWQSYPQETADLIRAKGHKLFSDRQTTKPIIT